MESGLAFRRRRLKQALKALLFGLASREHRVGHAHSWFHCPACGTRNSFDPSEDAREGRICHVCGLNARMRAIFISVVSAAIQLEARVGSVRPIRIVGVSDGEAMEHRLRATFGSRYENFQFHTAPRLDITRVPAEMSGRADLVVCSEVLEHVEPPIDAAFAGLHALLSPGGVAVVSVPTDPAPAGDHVEHFPPMREAVLVRREEKWMYAGVDEAGETRVFGDLAFHGGAGTTLEFRVFSETSLRRALETAGFVDVEPQPACVWAGIDWGTAGRVWVARKSA